MKYFKHCILFSQQISRLELQISQQHAIRKDLEALFDEEKAFAAEQHRKDENALTKMQKHIDFIRKREQSVKEELLEVRIFCLLVFNNQSCQITAMVKLVVELCVVNHSIMVVSYLEGPSVSI